MTKVVKNILEKMKKVEDGYLDQEQKGADEQNFIDKHVDNVQVSDGPGVDDDHPHTPKNPDKMSPRKKHRKGYEPGEDAEVYESVDDDNFFALVESLSLTESTDFLFDIIDESVKEFIEEDASEEEVEIINEMLSTDEGYAEFLEMIFESEDEGEECEECGESPCECEDDVIDDKPKTKKTENGMSEEIERRADVKMVKVKNPDGKVTYRKQRKEVDIERDAN